MAGRVLVFAPHPDDEVLGVGGTMARMADQGAEVTVVTVTRGFPPYFSEELVASARSEAAKAHTELGVRQSIFLDFPAAALDRVERRVLNAAVRETYETCTPDYVFLPFAGDIHLDHQIVFQSAMVACRPNGGHVPQAVLAYETVSETNWNAPPITPGFMPNTFFDISKWLERKMRAFGYFASQVRPFPNERSLETLRALAVLRGSAVCLPAAEAFVTVRQIL